MTTLKHSMVVLFGLFALAWPSVVLAPQPCNAQQLICCNIMLKFEGKWIGVNKRCQDEIKNASRDKRMRMCRELRKAGKLCPAVEQVCKACSGNDGDGTYPSDHPVVQQLIDGFHAQGIDIGPQHLLVEDDKGGDLIRFVVRLDRDSCVLPDGQCVVEAVTDGTVPEGKQVVAAYHLYGSIQQAGTKTRVSTRVVSIETGIIQRSGKADASGAGAISTATAASLDNMGTPCTQAKGLIFE